MKTLYCVFHKKRKKCIVYKVDVVETTFLHNKNKTTYDIRFSFFFNPCKTESLYNLGSPLCIR